MCPTPSRCGKGGPRLCRRSHGKASSTGADSALAENKQLCGALTLGIQLSTALETWPGGMTALADKGTQIFDDGLSSLVKSELSSYQSASGDYTPLEVQGVCALGACPEPVPGAHKYVSGMRAPS